ncbi:hypothetical protein [Desulfovibrio litoralis]|uniref:Uncharacterized protein n=1 Tax=Desulfovibrio litoralis DSM 11393 TaxID=1121455 RepID=A0A1M7STF2_9BACT|nr:hypothetical protein [Desulfovibrio litoralis]SHN61853.1 hypothetical protein SAMN02745728_01272 [Desulfovibrio litoralis DSM 11393]
MFFNKKCNFLLWCCLFCQLALSVFLSGCAVNNDLNTPNTPKEAPLIVNGKIFRQKIKVNIANNKEELAFDGILYLDSDNKLARVIGLASMTTLFDIVVTQDSFYVRSMHPGMKRIKGLERYVAECVQGLWLLSDNKESVVEERQIYTDFNKKFTVSITSKIEKQVQQ